MAKENILEGLSWSCHFCGKIKPDLRISVVSRKHILAGDVEMQENQRYCNDDPICVSQAQIWQADLGNEIGL